MAGSIERAFGPRTRRAGPVLAALIPTLVLGRSLLEEAPLSYDHATHLFKAWHFWTEMLGRGRLRGWSHYWAFGFPADELVPLGGELWVDAFRALTLGQLSWTRTYALAFAGFLVFKALAVFYFSRRFFGVAAAVVAAWIASVDPGGMLEGGWLWHSYWGVWPVTLAMGFAQLGLARLDAVLEARQRSDVAWAAACFAAALLAHPLALVLLAGVVPLLLLEHRYCRRGLLAPNTVALFVAAALAFGLAAFTYVPFMARAGDTQDLGHLGDSLRVVLAKLVQLRTFENVWSPIHALALAGAFIALRRRRTGAALFVLGGALFVLLSSDALIADLHLERALGSLTKLEMNRMLVAAKLFWFPLAGHALVELARAAARRVPMLSAFAARHAAVALAAALAVVLVVPGLPGPWRAPLATLIRGEQQTRYFRDFEDLVAWSQQERQRAGSEHYRIAYHSWRGNHLPTLAAVYDQTLIYNTYFTPTQIFDKLPLTDENQLLRALSVKYVVAPLDLERADVELERRFGELRVYRFKDYDPRPFTLLGPGTAELVRFEPERVVIRLRGTEPTTRIVVHVASYERWQATLDGKPVPIVSVPVLGAHDPILMEVPAAGAELALDYVYRGSDWVGLCLSLASLTALAWLAWRARGGVPLGTAWSLPPAWRVRARRGGAALALALAGLVLLRTRSRAGLLPADSLFRRLDGEALRLGEHACRKLGELSFACGPHRVEADMITGIWAMHRCMHAPDVGPLIIDVPTRLGSFLRGSYDPAKDGAGRIQASVGGVPLGDLRTRPSARGGQAFQFDTRAYAGAEGRLQLTVSGAALHCFDLRVLP